LVILSILLGLCGLFFFLKSRKAAKSSETNLTEASVKEEPLPPRKPPVSDNLDLNVQKNKRAGYSKQQFDEFE
jgi:hypothetical protein